VIKLFIALTLFFTPSWQAVDPPWQAASAFPATGEVTYYAPGLMEWVYELRIVRGEVPVCDPPQCAGYAATLRPGDLGRLVWLRPLGRPAEGPFLVVDYAAEKDFERLRARGLVAEVDFKTAQRWGMRGTLHDVQVLTESPNTERIVLPLMGMAGTVEVAPAPAPPRRQATRLWLPLTLHDAP